MLRKRTNNHISCGKSGKSKNRANRHFFECNKEHQEPLFQLYVLLELNDYDKLRVYEDDFHKRGFDTCNRYKSSSINWIPEVNLQQDVCQLLICVKFFEYLCVSFYKYSTVCVYVIIDITADEEKGASSDFLKF